MFLYLCSCLASLVFIALSVFYTTRRNLRLPPGPSGLSYLKALSSLWRGKVWLHFTEWKAQYGPVVCLKIAGRTIIVLNTHKAAIDLLERRGKNYDHRPRSILSSEIMTGGLAFPLVGYGSMWKRHRRAAHSLLNPRVVGKYRPVQEQTARVLVQAIAREPEKWPSHIQDSLYVSFRAIGYGYSSNDPVFDKDAKSMQLETFMERIVQATIPGTSMVDFFPILASLPSWLARWKHDLLQQFQKDSSLFESFFSGARSDSGNGSGLNSMSSILQGDKENLSTIESAWLIAVLCGVGAEVTSSVLPIFILAMVLYPDVQHRAQVEIDEMIGRDRHPSFQDYDKLPYVQALVQETLRWRPIGPIGFPRCSLEDDIYMGYLIPAGSIIVPNIWAMNRDPLLYPDYDEFRPERFLESSSLFGPETHGQGHVSYGFGDRICSGMHLANSALFINIAFLLWAVNIEKAIDSEGNNISPSRDAFDELGIVTRPSLFPCEIKPRHNVSAI